MELTRRAELQKLARVLRVEPSQLGFLERIDPMAVRGLRERVSDRLFEADSELFQRLVAGSRMLPVSVAAVISERALGPLICARTSGLMPVRRAIDIAVRLPTEFLAQTCLLMDPKRADKLIQAFPVDRMKDVCRELAKAGEFVVMARFVDSMSNQAIGACMDELDDRQVLSIAFFVEDKSRFNEIVGWLGEERLCGLVRTGASNADLRTHALMLMSEVDDRWKQRLGNLAVELGDEFISDLAQAASDEDLWSALLPVVALMSDANRRYMLSLPLLKNAPMLTAILRAADQADLWRDLLPMLPLMGSSSRKRLASQAAKLDDDSFPRIAEAAIAVGCAGELLELLGYLTGAQQRRIVALPAFKKPDLISAMVHAADGADLWPILLAMAPNFDTKARKILGARIDELDDGMLARIASSASRAGHQETLAQLVAELHPTRA